jgi:hypothetical protein
MAEVCDVLHTAWGSAVSLGLNFGRKKEEMGNARPLSIVWQVQLCHQLIVSARNCCYIMHMVT